MDAAVATWRHWLPKREGAHEVGRTAGWLLPHQILILYLQK